MPNVLVVVLYLKDLRTNSFTPAGQGLVKSASTRDATTLNKTKKKAAP